MIPDIRHEIWVVIRLPLIFAGIWIAVSLVFSLCIAHVLKGIDEKELHITKVDLPKH